MKLKQLAVFIGYLVQEILHTIPCLRHGGGILPQPWGRRVKNSRRRQICSSRCTLRHWWDTFRTRKVTARAVNSSCVAMVNLCFRRLRIKLRWTDWTRSSESK